MKKTSDKNKQSTNQNWENASVYICQELWPTSETMLARGSCKVLLAAGRVLRQLAGWPPYCRERLPARWSLSRRTTSPSPSPSPGCCRWLAPAGGDSAHLFESLPRPESTGTPVCQQKVVTVKVLTHRTATELNVTPEYNVMSHDSHMLFSSIVLPESPDQWGGACGP